MGGRIDIIRHAAVFIAAIALIWFAGVLPAMILAPEGAAPVPPAPSASGIAMGLLSAWPIYIGVAIVQALTFHYVKRFATPIFLTTVFILAFILAWRYTTAAPI